MGNKIFFVSVVAILSGECAAGADAEKAPAGREWSAARVGGEIAGEDSWHVFNHTMFAIQDVAMDYVVKPLNCVYC